MALTETIVYSADQHIARITLDNPHRHNALGEGELAALQHHLSSIESNPAIRVLVLSGCGEKTFCAGAALGQLSTGAISANRFQQTTDQLAALRVPTICAANGSLYGGGAELALSCDFRIGVTGSRLRVPAAQFGLCYPTAGIERYVERLGLSLAKRILMAAEPFDAEQLLDMGFFDHLVAPADLRGRAQQLAAELAELAPLAVQSMKQLLQQAASGSIDSEQALALSSRCSDSVDLQEGFVAQREKRKPVFVGK
jgi:enoyl-CoA hydratase/carnithine racemase